MFFRALPIIAVFFSTSVSAQENPQQSLMISPPQLESSVAPFVPLSDAPLSTPPVSNPAAVEAATPSSVDSPPPAEPETATAPSSFVQALVSAYQYHPQLKAERESLAALDETVAQAVSAFRPNVEATYSRGREKREVGDSGDNFSNTNNKSLTAEQPIFRGGQSWANFKSARDRVKAGRARLHAVEQQVLYDAVLAYSALVERSDILKLNQSNVDVLKRQLEATQARFNAGELTQTDVAQSQARLLQAQADERRALGDLEVAKANYRRVITTEPPVEPALPKLPEKLPASLEEALRTASERNPSLIAANFEEKAASTDIDARGGALLPQVSLRGSLDRLDGASNQQTGRVDSDALTLNVTIPLYQSGADWSRLRQARNLADKAKFDALDTRSAVSELATSAWQDFSTAQAVILSTREALKAAELALEGVRQENQFGTRTILDVLDAQQEAFQARVNLIIAQRAEIVQAHRLLAATGQLTARELSLPTELYDPKEHYDDVKYQLLGW
ncbi:MAG: TolC family outer membrane protein [Alphaproteobacteria bacterium]|nr:TolC family outer membrane protein [Alphaproteobacteria bacterium]